MQVTFLNILVTFSHPSTKFTIITQDLLLVLVSSLPRVWTNYGKFNIRYNGASIWNSIDESIKDLSKIKFKKCLISKILDKYLI